MKFFLSIIFVVGTIFLAGCSFSSQQTQSNISFADEMSKAFQAGATLTEIQNPNLDLPMDIHPVQIKFYFQIGDLFLAPVLRTSMNVNLENRPLDFPITFSGLIAARKNDKAWYKFVEIKDPKPDQSSKNNPYYLWEKDHLLSMSIVDENGGGSGEGFLKIFTLNPNGNWHMDGCYYFGPSEPYESSQFGNWKDENGHFMYVAKFSDLDKLDKVSIESDSYCKNVEVIPMNNEGY